MNIFANHIYSNLAVRTCSGRPDTVIPELENFSLEYAFFERHEIGRQARIDEANEQRVGKKESRSPHLLFSKTRRKRKKRKVEPLPRSGVHITTMRAISHPKCISLPRRPSCWHFPFSRDFSSFFSFITKVSGTIDSILKHG